MEPPAATATPEQIATFLTTEHYALQSIRSGTIADSNGRTALFLGTLSGSLVALALVGQVSQLGEPMFLLAMVVFPTVLFIGLVTYLRVLQVALEDILCMLGIARIRHYYQQMAPQTRPYFVLGAHDDLEGIWENYISTIPAGLQIFMTTAGMVAVINSVLAGVTAALFLSRIGMGMTDVLPPGVAAFVLVLVGLQAHQARCWRRMRREWRSRFPSHTATEGMPLPAERGL
ncbi:MAG: hypothetical protein M3295_01255 [Chloroflexota bacterium]|nr:hypothetical protein [Chloroflexota bacterium]